MCVVAADVGTTLLAHQRQGDHPWQPKAIQRHGGHQRHSSAGRVWSTRGANNLFRTC